MNHKTKRTSWLALFILGVLLFLAGCPNPSSNIENGSSEIVDLVFNTGNVHKITDSVGAANDYFGYSVAMSGDYAVVGSYYDDDNGGNSGSAYVFHRTGPNSWDTGTKLLAPGGASGDYFGVSVAISGDYVVVGAYQHEIGEETNSGAAFVFQRTGINSWDTGTTLVALDGAEYDYFGKSVAISGDYIVVGADGDDTSGDTKMDSGSAYVFHRTGSNSWDSGTKLLASDGETGDNFGFSVAISGAYAVVGAYNHDNIGDDSGAVYVFNRTGTNSWDVGAKVTPSDAAEYDYFGKAVAISGDYVLVGATGNDDNGGLSGSAYLFHRTIANNWDTGTKLLPADGAAGDYFGTSVAISGDYALVGTQSTGLSAYVFHRNGTSWEEGTTLVASDPPSNNFGYSVAISGAYALVGAPGDNDNGAQSGSAYIYHAE